MYDEDKDEDDRIPLFVVLTHGWFLVVWLLWLFWLVLHIYKLTFPLYELV